MVSYANDGDRIRQDVLNRVSFTKRSNKVAQGDKKLKVDLDLTIAGVIEQDGVPSVWNWKRMEENEMDNGSTVIENEQVSGVDLSDTKAVKAK